MRFFIFSSSPISHLCATGERHDWYHKFIHSRIEGYFFFLNKFHVSGDGDRRQLPPHNINIFRLRSPTMPEIQISVFFIHCRPRDLETLTERVSGWAIGSMSGELTCLILTMRSPWRRRVHTLKGIHPYGLSGTKLKIQYRIIMSTIFLPSS